MLAPERGGLHGPSVRRVVSSRTTPLTVIRSSATARRTKLSIRSVLPDGSSKAPSARSQSWLRLQILKWRLSWLFSCQVYTVAVPLDLWQQHASGVTAADLAGSWLLNLVSTYGYRCGPASCTHQYLFGCAYVLTVQVMQGTLICWTAAQPSPMKPQMTGAPHAAISTLACQRAGRKPAGQAASHSWPA
ncbi:hypothetical protein WJX73_008148 [Symbiochloris irregularis]|uniref:Uncharacterized protein n=1 Tax=Symbiochloris irregularis TaxID=706552 RepID=A0AAW1NQU7_9CHLO